MNDLEWDDIGYNFLIGQDGRIYEGRDFFYQETLVGAFVRPNLMSGRLMLRLVRKLMNNCVLLRFFLFRMIVRAYFGLKLKRENKKTNFLQYYFTCMTVGISLIIFIWALTRLIKNLRLHLSHRHIQIIAKLSLFNFSPKYALTSMRNQKIEKRNNTRLFISF